MNMRLPGFATLCVFPEGRNESSPGWSPPRRTEPWDSVGPVCPRPVGPGRTSTPHVSRIVFDVVLFQKGAELGLEISPSMMILLTSDVRQRGAPLRRSNGEGSVPFLPFKALDCAGLMHPTRGCTLDFPHCFRNRERRWERKKDMDVVLRSTNCEGFQAVFSRNASHISPQLGLDFRSDRFAPLFRGEDTVKQRGAIGV